MLSYTTGQKFQVKFAKEKSTDFWWLFLINKMLDNTWFWGIVDEFLWWKMLTKQSWFSYKALLKMEIDKTLIDHRAVTDIDFLKEDSYFTEMFDVLPWKSTINNFQNQATQKLCYSIREIGMTWLKQFSNLLYSDNEDS